MNSEIEKTPREIAEEIVSAYEAACSRSLLIYRIIQALHDRDERAAKVADNFENEWVHAAQQLWDEGNRSGVGTQHGFVEAARAIASAIRGKSK